MTRKISISIGDFVWDTYLSEYKSKGGNISRYIESLIIKGSEYGLDDNTTKARLLVANQENHKLQEELNILKAENGRLKKKLKYKDVSNDPDYMKKVAFVKGFQKNNPLGKMS